MLAPGTNLNDFIFNVNLFSLQIKRQIAKLNAVKTKLYRMINSNLKQIFLNVIQCNLFQNRDLVGFEDFKD